MTKEELCALVDQAYMTFNVPLPVGPAPTKLLYASWFDLLHDLEYKDAKAAFLTLAVEAQFLPRPGEIRRTTINRLTKMTQFEDPLSAWGTWITIQKDVNSGMAPSIAVSEALKETVKQLGDAAIGMHTNSDREAFCRAYSRVVSEMDIERYAVPEIKEQ